MNLDNEFSFTPFTLPSLLDGTARPPTGRTPSRQSRRVSRSSRAFDASAIRLGDEGAGGKAGEEGDKMSPLDPRRLTPTLHATLVSEILSIRQEMQTKNKEMLRMEESLSAARDENNKLNDQVAEHVKDSKSLRRQMQMLEGGTMSALDELASERDRANETVAELKKRLETSQTKAKKQGDDVERTNSLWLRDQENWDAERRTLERKIHIVEGRLRTVLEEIEQAQQNGQVKHSLDFADRAQSRASRASGTRSAASARRDSSTSSDGNARSRLSHITEISRSGNAGTLADELAFDEDDLEDSIDEPMSPEALPEEKEPMMKIRPFSAQSQRQSVKAFKLLGLVADDEEVIDATGRGYLEDPQYGDEAATSRRTRTYQDSATQYTPPASPSISTPRLPHGLEPITEASSLFTLDESSTEHEYEEARAGTDRLSFEKAPMVSSAVQTVEQPLSPPDTPKESKKSALATAPKVPTSTVATQTDDIVLPPFHAASRGSSTTTTGVPVISIHPPSSSHSNYGGVMLPPHTKSVSCQAAIAAPTRSVSMQTEGIRIDKRPIQLPAHLLPSAISSKPPTPVAEQLRKHIATPDDTDDETMSRGFTQKAKRASKDRRESVTKHRNSNLQAVDAVDAVDGYVSDDSFISREPVKKTLSRVENSWKISSAYDDEESAPGTAVVYGSGKRALQPAMDLKSSKTPESGFKNKAGKALHINTSQAQDMRKAALVASGSATHVQQRSRSPSLPTLPSIDSTRANPPFPVPDRSSSRKFPWETSDGLGSPSPQAISFFGQDQKDRRHKRPPVKKQTLRKSRSQTADMYHHRRSRSRSPPLPTSGSSWGDLESPGFDVPPLPNDDISSPFRLPKTHEHKPSVANSANSAGTSESVHVVDAIAQTMIGEWMWKYVRRRKSFGLQSADDFDARGRDADSMRHQRWVWLAPWERAVLWSSKPPVSSTALQGKLGQRKLEIQSVLDVRDDNPMPKGADPAQCFGRSILILTPQRALKFTAMSRERHYLWLSALSFLSQPGIIPADLGGVPAVPSRGDWLSQPPPPPPQHQQPSGLLESRRSSANSQAAPAPQAERTRRYEAPEPKAMLRRHPIRDSIRVAKGKARPTFPDGGRRSHTSPAAPPPAVPGPWSGSNSQIFEEALEEQREDEAGSGCEAPHVPRTTSHTRKRSNTGPRGTASQSFRSFASKQAQQQWHGGSAHTSFASSSSRAVHSDHHADGSSAGNSRFSSFRTNPPHHAGWDEAATPPMPPLGSAASSVNAGTAGRGLSGGADTGTMRMEAFIRGTLGGAAPAPNVGGRPAARRPAILTGIAAAKDQPQSAPLLASGRVGRSKVHDPFAGF